MSDSTDLTIEELLVEHVEAKAALDKWKKRESMLRLKIIDELSPDNISGTTNHTVGNAKVKIGKNMSYKLDNDVFQDIKDNLTEEEQDCILMTPKLVLRAYKITDDTGNLDEAITVSPSMPTLKIEFGE